MTFNSSTKRKQSGGKTKEGGNLSFPTGVGALLLQDSQGKRKKGTGPGMHGGEKDKKCILISSSLKWSGAKKRSRGKRSE